ncbi:divergent polysaccharide deacetylase family protein [Tepidamorphus gemmatus]|uniref:divergent polysaccharide deacetylase family protein n=1 Tax=Tepidamorphus gemmatus TaxID=747076 RepID=UPI0014049797|nr:divergent polysaccharide deacetylase family protein [Tepidamorphus gemmatus]
MSVRKVVLLLAATAAVLLAGRLLLFDDPLGGEPVAVVQLDSLPASRANTGETTGMRATLESEQPESLPDDQALPPADIVIGDPLTPSAATGGGEIGLVEMSRHGPIPAIAPDGRRPFDAYARPLGAVPPTGPRIAIVLGGLGLSTLTTETAIDRLPAEITLAFAPYGDELERLSARARQAGHELLLHVPLEPYDYPDSDPGPHTLLTGLDPEQNRDRLHWLMSRFSGYAGVLNYMGARFTASEDALRPFLGELRDRGLVYIDDGTSPRSAVPKVAREIGLSVAVATRVVDAVPTRAAIDEALRQLEDSARETGSALGIGSALPVSIEAIREWARGLEARGVTLVPASALVGGGAI